MTTIETVLYKVADFYTWLYSALGLEKWQVLAIATAIMVMLLLIAIHQRKKKVKEIHTIPTMSRSDIIGAKLSGQRTAHHDIKEIQKLSLALTPESDEKQMGWGQTTKEWRKLTEQIRQLNHEIIRHKRTEEQLNHQIAELTTTNKKLQEQIDEQKQAVKSPRPQVSEVTSSDRQGPAKTANESLKPRPVIETTVDEQIRQEVSRPEQTNRTIGQEIAEPAAIINEQPQNKENEDENVGKETKCQTAELNNADEQFRQEATEDSKQNGVPLDVQELKSISELAKRLRGNNRP